MDDNKIVAVFSIYEYFKQLWPHIFNALLSFHFDFFQNKNFLQKQNNLTGSPKNFYITVTPLIFCASVWLLEYFYTIHSYEFSQPINCLLQSQNLVIFPCIIEHKIY